MVNVPGTLDIMQQGKGNQLSWPEIRVWCHGTPDDYYYTFDSFKDAWKFIEQNQDRGHSVEPYPLVAVGGYELDLFHLPRIKPKSKGGK